MINPVLVEGIAARRLLRRQPMEVFAGHEPEERPLARTDRAIARQYALQIALGFELDATAMTTALVFHANFSPEVDDALVAARDRKSTRLNSSHSQISYAVFCLKKKTK